MSGITLRQIVVFVAAVAALYVGTALLPHAEPSDASSPQPADEGTTRTVCC